MKILVTGSSGMLGHDLTEILKDNHELILTTSKTLDITDKNHVIEFICENKPDIVINSAAYTNVDGCEENQETAYSINGDGVRNLAMGCSKIDCPLVHISTDYVFNGKNTKPWVEDDEIGGSNFPKTMLELAKNHSEITVVYDEVGTPTYTPDLAKAISQLIETDYYGIYHITNSGSCSWCEFARYIFEIAGKDVKVIPVTASEFARPAPRPHYSVLENKKWIGNGFEPLRSYKDAIKEYIGLIK